MTGFDISIILDKKNRALPKPINIRPGFDMRYVKSYILNYTGSYGNKLNQVFDNERLFDNLSAIKHNETPFQWSLRVRIPLQNLISEGKFSFYHRYALFSSFGQGKFVNSDYRRPRIHKSHMAICFGCWQLTQVNDAKPKKVYASAIHRYIEKVEPVDLMQYHWDNECSKAKTKNGSARIIQRAWRRFQEKEPSNARLAWLSLPNDNTPIEKKFLGLTQRKVKNPQTREQFNHWNAEKITMYRRCNSNMVSYFINNKYEEYFIPYDWIGRKKNQLRDRFQKRLLALEA